MEGSCPASRESGRNAENDEGPASPVFSRGVGAFRVAVTVGFETLSWPGDLGAVPLHPHESATFAPDGYGESQVLPISL